MTEHEKLDAFTAAILNEARQEAEHLRTEDAETIHKAVEEYRAVVSAEAERRKAAGAAAAKSAADRRIAAAALAGRRTVLEYRERRTGEIYGAVRQRVEAYPGTPDYPGTLEKLLAKALSAVPGAGAAEILLRPEDRQHEALLSAASGKTALSFGTGSFRLGGLILLCPERDRRVDLSFDSALADIQGRFSELTGFHMEE